MLSNVLVRRKVSGTMNYSVDDSEKYLASFHDAFSPILGRRTKDPATLELILGADTKFLDGTPHSSHQWSPTKAVNPSQIFKVKKNTNRRLSPPQYGERFTERPAVDKKYSSCAYAADIRNDSLDAEFQKVDSDYFSADSSPQINASHCSPAPWDARAFPRFDCMFANANRNPGTVIPQPRMMQSFHIVPRFHQDVYAPLNTMNHLSAGKLNMVPSAQWYLPVPAEVARPISVRQFMPDAAPRPFFPSYGELDFIGIPASLKYMPQMQNNRPETLITEPVATANASVQASIASPELKVTDEDENQPMATDETPISTPTKSQTKAVSQTKERVRERAIRDLLNSLIKILPYEVCKSARPLKSTILEKTVEYVTTLQEDIALIERRLTQQALLPPIISFVGDKSQNFQQSTNTLGSIPPQTDRPEQPEAGSHKQEKVENMDATANEIKAPSQDNPSSDKLPNVATQKKARSGLEKFVANLKRPLNSFMLYSKEQRERVVRENPGMDNRAISRKLGDEWSHLTPEEKSPYRQRFQFQLNMIKSAFPNWTYNSYKGREWPIKRKYRKRALSSSEETSGRSAPEVAAKKGKPELTTVAPETLRLKITEKTFQSPDATIDTQSCGNQKVAPHWSSWLRGGPYFSCSFPNSLKAKLL